MLCKSRTFCAVYIPMIDLGKYKEVTAVLKLKT